MEELFSHVIYPFPYIINKIVTTKKGLTPMGDFSTDILKFSILVSA